MLKKAIAVCLMLALIAGLLPISTLPSASASAGGETDISEMNALEALGFDTSEVPDGVDLDSPDNPYGRETTNVNPVYELFVQGQSSSTLYGHNKPVGKSWDDFYDSQRDAKSTAIIGDYAATATASGNFTRNSSGATGQAVTVAAGELSANGGLYLYFSDPVNNQKGADRKVLLGTDKVIGNTGNQMNEDFAADPYLMQNYLQIVTGDYDGDGVDEVAVYVAQQGSSRVEIYDLQLDDTFDEDTAATYYLDSTKWAKAWTYYFNESPYVSNMVSLTGGDINQDGTDDLALTWGYYYGLNNYTNSRAVLLCGSKTSMLQKSMNINLEHGGSQIVRAAFAYGDVDGDNVNDLILGGQLNSDILGGNLNSRFVAVYTYNGDSDSFIQSVAENFDLFATEKNDAGQDVYVHAVMADHNKIFYSLPTMVANISAVNMRGVGYASNIYIDSLILEYGDQGLVITAALDQNNSFNKHIGVDYPDWIREINGRFYTEYSAVAADFTGDTAQTMQVMLNYSAESYSTEVTYAVPSYKNWWNRLWRIKSWSSVTETLSFSVAADTVMAAVEGKMTQGGGGDYTFAININASSVDFSVSFCTLNSDNDTSFISYTSEHGVIYSDPKVLAVLASPPHFGDLSSDQLSGSYMESSTSYSSTKGSGTETTKSNTLSVGAYVSYQHDFTVPITGTKVAGMETELAYTQGWTWETTKSSMVEMSITYETVVGQDSVAFYSIPMEYYIYDSYVPIIDETTGQVTGYDQQKMSINLPHTAAVTVLSLEKYERIAADYDELPQIAGTVLTHTVGSPATYPSSSAGYSNVLEYSGSWAGVDYSAAGASVSQEIAITEENGDGLTSTNTLDFKIGAGPGSFIFGVTAGYEHGSSKVTISSEGSTYAGTVYNMPIEAEEYGYYYAWKLFTYSFAIGDNSVPVVSYLVKDVTAPPFLPSDFAQDSTLTTDQAIGLTWSYPSASSVAGFQIYRYYEFSDGSGSYELAFVPASQVSYTTRDSNGKLIRHYQYVDEGLADYTSYDYQIQVIRSAVPTATILSDVLTARTKAELGYPTITLSGVTPRVTTTYDEQTGEETGSVTDYSLLVYPDTSSTVSVSVAEHYDQAPRYQWQKRTAEGWSDIAGATRAAHTFSNSGVSDEGEYRCRLNVIYEDADVGQIYYISAYSRTFTLDYSLRSAKVADGGFAVDLVNKTVSLALKSNHNNHTFAPSGNVTFVIAGADYNSSYTVRLGSASPEYVTTATLNLGAPAPGYTGDDVYVDLPAGVYDITAYYGGSRVFGSLDVSNSIYYVSGDSSGHLLNMNSSFTYGDAITPQLMSVGLAAGQVVATQVTAGVTYKVYEEQAKINTGSYIIAWPWGSRTYYYTYKTYEYVECGNFILGDGSVTARSAGSYRLVAYVDGTEVASRDIRIAQKEISIGFVNALTGVAGNGSISHPTYSVLKLASGQLVEAYGDTLANLGLVVKAYDTAGRVVTISPTTDPGLYTIVGAAAVSPSASYGNYSINYVSSTYILTGPKYDMTIESQPFGADNAIVGTVAIIRPEVKEDNGEVVNMTTSATNGSFFRDDVFTGGTGVTLRAAAQTGYQVKSWTVAAGSTVTTTVTAATTFTYQTTANDTVITVEFELAKNRLHFQSANSSRTDGTVTPVDSAIQSGAVAQPDSSYTFLASPAPGYHFVQWTLAGSTNSNFLGEYDPATGTSRTTLTMGRVDTILSAVFQRDSYTLELGAGLEATYLLDDGFGNPVSTTSISTVSIPGDTAVTVRPRTGYSLSDTARWSVNGEAVGDAGAPSCTFTITADTIVGVGGTNQNNYPVSATVQQPDETSDNKVIVRIDNAIVENFSSLAVSGGSSLTFTAVEAWGYTFSQWKVNGDAAGTNKTLTIAQLGAATAVQAEFIANPNSYTVTASHNSGGRLTYSVIYGKPGYSGNAPTNAELASGTSITAYAGDNVVITAIPEANQMLRSWTVGDVVDESPENVLTIESIAANATVAARFIPMSFATVSYAAEGDGSITSATSNGVPFASGSLVGNGTRVVLTAAPGAGKMVAAWTVDGETVKTSGDTPFIGETLTIDRLAASSTAEIKVHFADLLEKTLTYDLTNVTVSRTYTPATYAGKTASTETTDYVLSGSKVQLTAEPVDDYRITEFIVGGVSVTQQPNGSWVYTIDQLNSDATVVARAAMLYSLSVDNLVGGNITISAKEPGKAIAGETISLASVTPDLDYRFAGWSYEENVEDNEDNEDNVVEGTSFVMPAADTTVSASFVAIPTVDITYSVHDTNGIEAGGTNGSISAEISRTYANNQPVGGYPVTDSDGSITVNRGYSDSYATWPDSVVTFTAAPASGYMAKFWRIDGVEVPASRPNQLILTVEQGSADHYDVQVQYELIGDKVTYDVANGNGTITGALLTSEFGETTNISSGHTLTIDGTITFSAEPASADYQVEGWYVNGVKQAGETGTTYVYQATAGAGAVVSVQFERVSYVVTYSGLNGSVAAAIGGNSLGNSPAVVVGDSTVTFTATANPGYAFSGWLVDGVSSTETANTLNLTIAATTTVEACFTEDENLPITYAVTGSGGSLTATRNGVDFASGSQAAANDVITFTAIPETVAQGDANNYRVAGWTVNGEAVGHSALSHQLTIDGVATVAVAFERCDYVLDFSTADEAYGGISAAVGAAQISSLDRVAAGSTVTFTATPSDGYQVQAWTVNEVATVTENLDYRIDNLSADTTVTVEFMPIPTYTISISTSGSGYGSVTAQVGDAPAVANATVVTVPRHGTVTLTAMRHDASNAFAGWTILPSNLTTEVQDNGIVLTLTGVAEDIDISAAFTPATMIELAASEDDPHGTLDYSGVQVGYLSANLMSTANLSTSSVQITSGMDVVIRAVPDEGYMVQQWVLLKKTGSDQWIEVQDELSKTLTLNGVSVDTAVRVTFEPLVTHLIPSSGSRENGGYYTVTPGLKVPTDVGNAGEIRDRGTVTFTVAADAGCYFTALNICGVDCLNETGSADGVTENVVSVVHQDGSYAITVANVKAAIAATIRAVKPILNITEPTNGAIDVSYLDANEDEQTVSSGDEVAVGTELKITATPDLGYFLKAWRDDASGLTGNAIRLPVGEVEEITVAAEFAHPTATVTVPQNGSVAVTYVNASEETVTLADTATAAAGESALTFAIPVGTELTITATPRSGYYQSSWGGAVAGKYGRVITLTVPSRDITVSAVFAAPESGGGGAPLPPVPPTPPTPPVTEISHKIITISPDGTVTEVPLESESTTLDDGRTLERISAPASFAQSIITDKAAGSDAVNISVGEFEVEAEERQPVVEVAIPTEVLAAASGMSLNLSTPHGTLSLPPQLVEAMAAQQQSLVVAIDRQPAETVRHLLPAGTEPIGEAMSVETDLTGPTKVTIGLNTDLPEDEAARQAFLAGLMTFAIHSSGTQEMIYDVTYDILETPYVDEQGVERIQYTLQSVSFGVDEFSSFVVVKPNQEYLATTVGVPGFTIAGLSRDMVACYYQNGDTMMPVRMLEDFGVSFQWDELTKTATMTYMQQTVVLTIGSTDAYINGVKTPIVGASGALVAPELSPGRTMIPLRFVSEHLGFKVTWDRSNLITIRLAENR